MLNLIKYQPTIQSEIISFNLHVSVCAREKRVCFQAGAHPAMTKSRNSSNCFTSVGHALFSGTASSIFPSISATCLLSSYSKGDACN